MNPGRLDDAGKPPRAWGGIGLPHITTAPATGGRLRAWDEHGELALKQRRRLHLNAQDAFQAPSTLYGTDLWHYAPLSHNTALPCHTSTIALPYYAIGADTVGPGHTCRLPRPPRIHQFKERTHPSSLGVLYVSTCIGASQGPHGLANGQPTSFPRPRRSQAP